MHLIWNEPNRRLSGVRVGLRVVEPPRTSDLYFFALQASFHEGGVETGGAHLGLQWNRRHPGSTAVNWGGYAAARRGGAILEGTESQLPSQPNDPNTRDYSWRPSEMYSLEIGPGSAPGWWRGTISNSRDEETTVRELHGGGSELAAPMVWAEVFAPCDAPSVRIEWTDLEVAVAGAGWVRPQSVTVNYQDYGAGGCTNTTSLIAGGALVQITSTNRSTPQGTVLGIDGV